MLADAGVTVLNDEAVRADAHFVVAGRKPRATLNGSPQGKSSKMPTLKRTSSS